MEKSELLANYSTRVVIDVAASEDFSGSEKPGILLFRFTDKDGRELEVPGADSRSAELGYFRYVNFAAMSRSQRFVLSVPEGAVRFVAAIEDWQSRIQNFVTVFSISQTDELAETDLSGASREAPELVDGTRVRRALVPGERYALAIDHIGSKGAESIISLAFAGGDGGRVLPPGDFPVHPVYGAHLVLRSTKEVGPTRVEFVAPHDATAVDLVGISTEGEGRAYIRSPQLEPLVERSHCEKRIRAWLEEAATARDLIVIRTLDAPFKAGASTSSRSGELALGLSIRGWKVLFVPSQEDSVDGGAALISEGLLQIAASALPSVLERLLTHDFRGSRTYLCSTRADFAAVAVQNRLQDHGWSTVYESCCDSEDLVRAGEAQWYRPAIEQRFAEHADGLIAVSPLLRGRLTGVTGRGDVELIGDPLPDALVDVGSASREADGSAKIREQRIVGYHGAVDEKLLDWRTLIEAALRLPDVAFEIIADGGGKPANVMQPPNVRLWETLSQEQAWERMRSWRVGVSPLVRSRLGLGGGGRLLGEYVALGLRSVSSSIGNPHGVPGLREYADVDGLVSALIEQLDAEPSERFYAECTEFAERTRWSQRITIFEKSFRGLTQ